MSPFQQKNSLPKIEETLDVKVIKAIRTAVEKIQRGDMVLIVEDEVEDEGDICIAAEMVTPQAINFMATTCRGLICQPIAANIAERLNLPLMVPNGGSPAFTVSVDAASVGSGTSAYDRAQTARTIVHPATRPEDLRRPGHIFPIIARSGGVLERPGHTEASIDIICLAGFTPSAVICEVMDEDGHMARGNTLYQFAEKNGVAVITVRDLIEYRRHFASTHLSNERQPIEQPILEVAERRNGRH
jgi:3,4-dihydroxy 2-butanone 4-phosphate synthase/GTP cyclohydrolase II